MLSLETDGMHLHMIKKVKTQVISTELWNPLIFAIFYGRIEIVKYII